MANFSDFQLTFDEPEGADPLTDSLSLNFSTIQPSETKEFIMDLSESGMTAAGFIPAILAGIDKHSRISASQNPSATPPPQLSRDHHPELLELVCKLELARNALMMGCDNYCEDERSEALSVVNQAIKDVYLAIESNNGWSVVHLDVGEPGNLGSDSISD